jgi:phosphohistidine phosphatase
MWRHLLLLRHGKSAWDTGALDDFGRPLARRGERDTRRMGKWMHEEGLIPDYVLSSPALRTKETSYRVCKSLDIPKHDIHFDPRLYLADVSALLAALADCPALCKEILLVGHNPGMEDLLAYLCGGKAAVPEDGKLMPTATLARLRLPDDWSRLEYGCARLVSLTRPRSLPAAD